MLRHVRVGKGTVGVRLLMIYLLGLDKAEWIEDIWKESSLESFLGIVGESIDRKGE